jgi:hypothetical protein
MADPQAGWYADPSGDQTRLRYWDGTQWTEYYTAAIQQDAQQTKPEQQSVPEPEPQELQGTAQPQEVLESGLPTEQGLEPEQAAPEFAQPDAPGARDSGPVDAPEPVQVDVDVPDLEPVEAESAQAVEPIPVQQAAPEFAQPALQEFAQQVPQQPVAPVPAPGVAPVNQGIPGMPQQPIYGASANVPQQPTYGIPVNAPQPAVYGAPANVPQQAAYRVPANVPQQPVYGAQQPPGYGYPPAHPPTNGLAIAALVCGILGFCFAIPGLAAIILGAIALRKPGGRGMAIAGLVMGIIVVVVGILLIVVFGPTFMQAFEIGFERGLRGY